MVPAKKRLRYSYEAEKIARKHSINFNANDWEQIWSILRKYRMPTYVYAISNRKDSLVKFGRSVNPGQRLACLQTANGDKLALCAFCEEQEDLTEKIIHKQLKKHRAIGEWFSMNPATEEMISRIRKRAGL